MAKFKIGEFETGPGQPRCVLIFGGRRQEELRGRLREAARRRWPDLPSVILWDAPDGRALGFDGPFELTSFFSHRTPEEMRGLISDELEA